MNAELGACRQKMRLMRVLKDRYRNLGTLAARKTLQMAHNGVYGEGEDCLREAGVGAFKSSHSDHFIAVRLRPNF